MEEKNLSQEVYENEYIPFVKRWGCLTNLVGAVLGLIPACVLTFVLGVGPWSFPPCKRS